MYLGIIYEPVRLSLSTEFVSHFVVFFSHNKSENGLKAMTENIVR
jgi:hypothetical protein